MCHYLLMGSPLRWGGLSRWYCVIIRYDSLLDGVALVVDGVSLFAMIPY